MKQEKNDLDIDLGDLPGEVVIVNSKEALESAGFFESLIEFQYGSAEESDGAFERIKESTHATDVNQSDSSEPEKSGAS